MNQNLDKKEKAISIDLLSNEETKSIINKLLQQKVPGPDGFTD